MKKKLLLTFMLTIMLMFTLTGCGAKVKTISIHGQKDEFLYGEDFLLGNNAVVTAYLDDNSQKTLKASEYEVDYSSFNSRKPGTYQIKVAYKENKDIFTTYLVSVADKVVSGISMLTSEQPKIIYYVGDELDLSIGKIMVTYTGGICEEINLNSEGVVVTGFDSTSAVNSQILNVSYAGFTTSYAVMISPKSATSLEIEVNPKSNYYVGDTLDRSIGSVKATYVTGKVDILPLTSSELTITGFNTFEAGENKVVTISHAGKSVTYTIDVIEPTLLSFELTAPTNLTYFIGQELNLTGGQIFATFDNGVKTIPLNDSDVLITGFDSSKVESGQVVTVTYHEISKTFNVDIMEKSVSTISLDVMPRLNYYIDEDFDVMNAVLKVNYNDGSEDNVSLDNIGVSISGFNSRDVMQNQVVTIAYGGVTTTIHVNILLKEIQRIEIVTMPTKVNYFVGQGLELEGLELIAYHQLGSEEVNLLNVRVSGFDSSAPINNQEITITYMGVSTTFNVNILEKSALNISFQTQPTKQYYVGDEINLNAGSLFVEFDDGSNEVVTLKDNRVKVTGFDSTYAVSGQVITIKFNEKEITYNVTIYVKEVISIRITPPTKTEYFIGDEINLAGLQIFAVYALGEEKIDMEDAEFSCTGFDSRVIVNNQEVTINFGGKTATFMVSIIEKVVTRIAINDDVRTRYYVSDKIDLTVGTLKVYYSNGTDEDLSLTTTGIVISGFNSTSEVVGQIITITYESKTCTYYIDVVVPKVSEVLITGLQTTYYTGDEFNSNQGSVSLVYEDGSTHNGDMSNVYTITFDTSEPSESYIMVLGYNSLNVEIEIEIEIIQLQVTGLEVKSNSKTVYCKGEKFDNESLVIEVTSNKGTYNLDLSNSQVTLSGFDSSVENFNVVCTISYMGASVNFTIEVIAVEVESIEIIELPRLNYYQEDSAITTWDFTGGVIKATTSVGGAIYVDMASDAVTCITEFDLTDLATDKEVIVEYAGKQVSFNINIYEPIVYQVYVETSQNSKYLVTNENGYNITLYGELASSIEIIFSDNNFTYDYQDMILNEYGEFEVVSYIYEIGSNTTREISINITIENYDGLFGSNFTYYNEDLETIEGVIEFSTNKATLEGFKLPIEVEVHQVIVEDVIYNFLADVELVYGENSIDLVLIHENAYYLITLNVTRLHNVISEFMIDSNIYQVKDIQEIELEYGLTHNFNFNYDENLYKVTINNEPYTSNDNFDFKITKYISKNNEIVVKLYTLVDYAKYQEDLDIYKQALEQYENGNISIMPQYPDEPSRMQEFKIIYGEYDYITSIDFVGDDGDYSYTIMNGYLDVTIEDFVKSFDVVTEYGYRTKIYIDTASGYLEYGLNNVIIEIYDSQDKLVQIAQVDVNYLPTHLDGLNVMVGDRDIFRSIIYLPYSENSIDYSVTMPNNLSMDVYYGDLETNKRNTITSDFNGWYNAHLGDNNIYFVVTSSEGSKVYVGTNIYTYEENDITLGYEVFSILTNGDDLDIELQNSNVIEIRKSQVNSLTKVLNEYDDELQNANIEWLDNGNTLKISYSNLGVDYHAYYKIKYILELSYADCEVYLIDNFNSLETKVDLSQTLEMSMSDFIYIETIDPNASVEVETNSLLLQVDKNTFMVQSAGNEHVTFRIIPADGNQYNIKTFTLEINVTKTQVFSVDFGGGTTYYAYQSLMGFDDSSDFKVTYYDIGGQNVTLYVTATISKDKLNVTNEGFEYVTVNLSHLNQEEGITISTTNEFIYLTSLENVKLVVNTNSNGYEYIEFYFVIQEQVIYHVVIVIEEVTPEFVFNLNFNDSTSSVDLTFVDSKVLIGDFVAMNIGMFILEGTITKSSLTTMPETISASITIPSDYIIIFATDMEDGNPIYGDITPPSDYNDLTLKVNSQGKYGIIYAIMYKMVEQSIVEQYMLMLTISEDGSSYVMNG